MSLRQRLGIQRLERALVTSLQTNVMTLNRQGQSDAVLLVFLEGLPRARGPVINAVFLAAEATLEDVAILAKIMKQSRDAAFVPGPERASMRGGPFCHPTEVTDQRLPLPMHVGTVPIEHAVRTAFAWRRKLMSVVHVHPPCSRRMARFWCNPEEPQFSRVRT